MNILTANEAYEQTRKVIGDPILNRIMKKIEDAVSVGEYQVIITGKECFAILSHGEIIEGLSALGYDVTQYCSLGEAPSVVISWRLVK